MTSRPRLSAIHSRFVCSTTTPTCARSRSFSATRISRPHRFTPRWPHAPPATWHATAAHISWAPDNLHPGETTEVAKGQSTAHPELGADRGIKSGSVVPIRTVLVPPLYRPQIRITREQTLDR